MSLESKTVNELKKICKEKNVKGYTTKKKSDIIDLLTSLESLSFKDSSESKETNQFRDNSLVLNKKLSKENRQENGIFFTPKKARDQIFDFLENMKFIPKKCLEPSCGSGEFLHDILDKYPKASVTGIEKHPIIFENTSKDISIKNFILLNQDFLDFTSNEKFDLIIGNPPYFVMKDKSNPLISKCMNGRANIFVLFIYKCLTQHLAEDGILAFVLPTSFYNCSYYELCRKYISENHTILDVKNITVSYIDTNQDTMILIVQNKKPTAIKKFVLDLQDRIFINPYSETLKKLLSESTTFEKLKCKVKTGEVVWNQNKESLTNDEKDSSLIIYSHNIQDGKLVFDLSKKDKKQYIATSSVKTEPNKGPALLISRGYGNKYKLNYTFVKEDIQFYGENHVNVILPDPDSSKKEIVKLFDQIEKSLQDEKTMKFIEMYIGNGALSKTEIETIFPIF